MSVALSDFKFSAPLLNFTDAAAQKVAELMQEEDNTHLALRVFITGGGCSGFQYGFAFEETANDDDAIIEKEVIFCAEKIQVRLLVDPLSFQYLQGADIDYRQDIKGEQFVIRNPNAKTTCGCGSSFSIEEPSEPV